MKIKIDCGSFGILYLWMACTKPTAKEIVTHIKNHYFTPAYGTYIEVSALCDQATCEWHIRNGKPLDVSICVTDASNVRNYVRACPDHDSSSLCLQDIPKAYSVYKLTKHLGIVTQRITQCYTCGISAKVQSYLLNRIYDLVQEKEDILIQAVLESITEYVHDNGSDLSPIAQKTIINSCSLRNDE